MKARDLVISIVSGVILAAVLIYYGATPVSWASDGNKSTSQTDGIRPVFDTDEDPFSWQIKELMLNNYHNWNSLQVEATTIWYRDGNEDFRVLSRAQINGDNQIRFEISQSNRNESYLWVLNDSGIYESNLDKGVIEKSPYSSLDSLMNNFDKLPSTINAVNTNVIYRHPIAMRVPSPIADYIYPVGFAQRANGFSLIGKDSIADRDVYVVEWLEEEPASLKHLFWVDVKTGIILKAVSYIGENLDELYEETVFTNIVLDKPIPDDVFHVTLNEQ